MVKIFKSQHPNERLTILSKMMIVGTLLALLLKVFHCPELFRGGLLTILMLVSVKAFFSSYLPYLEKENKVQVDREDRNSYLKRYHRSLQVIKGLKVQVFFETVAITSLVSTFLGLDVGAMSLPRGLFLAVFVFLLMVTWLGLRKLMKTDVPPLTKEHERTIHSSYLFAVWLPILTLLALFVPMAVILPYGAHPILTLVYLVAVFIFVLLSIFGNQK